MVKNGVAQIGARVVRYRDGKSSPGKPCSESLRGQSSQTHLGPAAIKPGRRRQAAARIRSDPADILRHPFYAEALRLSRNAKV